MNMNMQRLKISNLESNPHLDKPTSQSDKLKRSHSLAYLTSPTLSPHLRQD